MRAARAAEGRYGVVLQVFGVLGMNDIMNEDTNSSFNLLLFSCFFFFDSSPSFILLLLLFFSSSFYEFSFDIPTIPSSILHRIHRRMRVGLATEKLTS